jgi:5-methylcytosine-specific restriction enzyme A
MTRARLRVCLEPGCPVLTRESRCPEHQRQKRQHERRFQTGQTHYGLKRWLVLRDAFRAAHPFCVNADANVPGCTLVTEVIDHVIPHRGDVALMHDPTNLSHYCWACHSRKTAKDVGFGG